MPVTTGLSTSSTRLANTAFANSFFPRAMQSVWPRVCGTTKSSSIAEPFAFLGAAPLLRLFQGIMSSQGIASYSMQVPNPVWKNFEVIKRNQFEFDQTRTLNARVGQHGVKVAQTTDYLLANQILNGTTAGSQNFLNPENGITYTTTFDNKPIYSTTHSNDGGTTTFNNIITGNLPTTAAAIAAQDITVTANQLHRDYELIVDFIASITDDKGALLFPDFDPRKQLIFAFPPILGAGAELAFRTQGTLGGSNGSSSGSTTNIGYKMVKDIIVWNLLRACPNIMTNAGASISPEHATQYYWMIDGDYVKPWYFQRFMPIKAGDTQPQGEDPAAQAEKVLRLAGTDGINVTPETADVYAATEVDTNLGALGSSAQESVVAREEFFISSRTRQFVFAGTWFNNGIVVPTGTST